VAIEGQRIGRYVLYDRIASGGMASVHFGRVVGPGGFARTVVIKRLHAHLVQDVEFASMFLDEGHLAARIHHPNVVPTIDVASLEGELLLVMEYVRGESLSRLLSSMRSREETVPPAVLSSIILGALYGLEAAHEAKSEHGVPLGIVHRDVSPQNIIVGADGLARVADFGVAKAAARSHTTRDGKIKGKLAYMAPEQLQRQVVDRRADIYAVGVILWEALAGRRLFVADDALAVMHAIVNDPIPRLSSLAPDTSAEMGRIVDKALSRRPEDRFASAQEMAEAIETALHPVLQRQVGAWLMTIAGEAIAERDRVLAGVETSTPSDVNAVNPMPDHIVRLSEQPTSTAVPAADAPSMVTGLSVSGEVAPRRRIGGRGLLAAGLLGSAAIGAIAFLALRGGSPAAPPLATASAAPPPDTSAPSPPSAAPAPDPVIASAAPSAPARPAAHPRPPAFGVPSPAHPSPAPQHPKSAGAKPGCDPAFTVGSDGIERFKPGCL
jgi:serine/threonine protein kinase